MKSKEDEKMVSSWEGFQKIAKLLGIEKMISSPRWQMILIHVRISRRR